MNNPSQVQRAHLTLLILSGSGSPLAFRLSVRKVSLLVLFASSVLLTSVSGSLLFFREVELNRHLEERLLELDVRERLSKYTRAFDQTTSRDVAAAGAEADEAKGDDSSETKADSPVKARLVDLGTECVPQRCDVKVSLVPSSTGIAQGQMLVVLEAEIPRIGSANATAKVRRRFFVYPGNLSRDELSADELGKFEHKPFKFSRALHTTVPFEIGSLLRPLAVNIYLYDNAGALVHHERRPIDNGE